MLAEKVAVLITFQLMPPRGGNLDKFKKLRRDVTVSTHAPARGQSSYGEKICQVISEFQLMPPRGGNHKKRVPDGEGGFMFQLMPPRGGNLRVGSR